MKSEIQICLLSSNFAPESLGIAKYSTDLAETLGNAGYAITVFAGTPHYPWGTDFRSSREIDQGAFRLIRLRHFRNLGNTKFGRFIFEFTFAIQLIKKTLFRKLGNVKLFLTVSPALGSLLATIVLNKLKKTEYILILHDLAHIGVRESGFSKSKFFTFSALFLEKYAIKRAQTVIVISDQMESAVRELVAPTKISSAVIYNYVIAPREVSGVEISREDIGVFNNNPIIMYTGASGFKQNLENIVTACNLLTDQPSMANLVLVTSQSFINEMKRKFLTLPTNLFLIESVPNSSFLSLLQLADFLLIHERGTVKEMCLPSKIATYLDASKPILSCSSEESATNKFLGDYAFRVRPDNPLALANLVRDISSHTIWPVLNSIKRNQLMEQLNADQARGRYMESIGNVLDLLDNE